jgi:hypothetical protein
LGLPRAAGTLDPPSRPADESVDRPTKRRGPEDDVSGRIRRTLIPLFLMAALLFGAASAGADEYDPQAAGHPIRIIAYALHPIGVALDVLIFRPAHWVGSQGALARIFGHETYSD